MRSLLLGSVAALATSGVWAQESPAPAVHPDGKAPTAKVEVERAYRASQLIGMDVRNSQGQDLGSIDDIVFDLDSGRIRYAAISFGGFLGIGDKLFAVPIDVLRMKHGADESHFVFDVTKDRLANAPGFNQDAWPNLGDRKWHDEVDAFYADDAREGVSTHTGQVVRAMADRLIMTGADGAQHTHVITDNVRITVDGRPAKLNDLKPGQEIVVSTMERNDAPYVTAIKASTVRR